jgi:hypothetical protein
LRLRTADNDPDFLATPKSAKPFRSRNAEQETILRELAIRSRRKRAHLRKGSRPAQAVRKSRAKEAFDRHQQASAECQAEQRVPLSPGEDADRNPKTKFFEP